MKGFSRSDVLWSLLFGGIVGFGVGHVLHYYLIPVGL